MKDRLGLALYLAAVVAATLIHRPLLLGAGLAVAVLAAGRAAPRVGRRALVASLPFLVVLDLSLLLPLTEGSRAAYLLRTDLRLLLLAWLSALLVERVNLFRALAPFRRLSALLVLASGQVLLLRRVLGDFRLALASRSPSRPTLRLLYRQTAATARHFLVRSESDGLELAQALRSRGFDLD
ncbi:MAG: ABC transporter permease [Candidatus Latescibacteria bacterium]|nr:ABC transporter permease [Candidatus Latescibacterota bacterium]